jgi:hypothetical protein
MLGGKVNFINFLLDKITVLSNAVVFFLIKKCAKRVIFAHPEQMNIFENL